MYFIAIVGWDYDYALIEVYLDDRWAFNARVSATALEALQAQK